MRIRSLRTAAASCTLAMAPIACYAQVGSPVIQPTQPAGQIVQPGTPGTVVTPGQAARSGDQTISPATDTRQVHASNASQQGAGSVQDFFVTKMMLANKAEVELGQMAQDRAQSDDVKQFAQMLVQEHQQLNQQLAQLQAGKQQTGTQPTGASTGNSQSTANAGANRAGAAPVQSRDSNAGTLGGANTASNTQPGRGTGHSQVDQHAQVPQQLTMICQQTAAKQLEMAREMLGEYQGQDFDMGFLGLQIAKHAHVVAELQSIENVGSQEFQQLVRTAEQKTSQHLDQAKQLANKLKDNKSNK